MDSHTTPQFLSAFGHRCDEPSPSQRSPLRSADASLTVSPAELAAHCASTANCPPSSTVGEGPDDSNLLRSFETIFQLQQRSDEIRSQLDHIDRVLLESRTVAGLTERLILTLQSEFEVSAARILIREDHPIASFLQWSAPTGVSTLPHEFFLNQESLFQDPLVLHDLSGELGFILFDAVAAELNSAVVVPLGPADDELGLLCLGSIDPSRYHEGMNTDLIASLAEKTFLGIANAWDHETSVREALMGPVEGLYSRAFFLEYLQKQFNGAWRNRSAFSLMAVSWRPSSSTSTEYVADISELVVKNLRSADLAASGDTVPLWVLLPHTDLEAARHVADRLTDVISERYEDFLCLHFGITEFSREAAVMPMLLKQASTALSEAEQAEGHSIVARRLSLEDYARQHAARHLAAAHS